MKRKKRNSYDKKTAVIVGLGLAIGVLTVVGFVIGIDAFFDRYDLKFQTPIILQQPVSINKRTKKTVVVLPDSPEASASVTEK